MTKSDKKTRSTPSSSEASNGIGLLHVFVVVAGFLAAYHFLVVPQNVPIEAENHSGAARGIVVVDSQAVMKAFMGVMDQRIKKGENFTENQLNASGADFGAEYLRAVKKYRDAGYLVFDKKNALGVPSNSEITLEIGEALNLQVELTADPFSALPVSGTN